MERIKKKGRLLSKTVYYLIQEVLMDYLQKKAENKLESF